MENKLRATFSRSIYAAVSRLLNLALRRFQLSVMRNCDAPSISFASLALPFISEPATRASKSNPRWLHFTDSSLEEEGQIQRNAICVWLFIGSVLRHVLSSRCLPFTPIESLANQKGKLILHAACYTHRVTDGCSRRHSPRVPLPYARRRNAAS